MQKKAMILTIVFGSFALQACSKVESEILVVQEAAWKSGRACLNRESLNSCSDFVMQYEKVVALMTEHEEEITKNYKNGDSDSAMVINNAKRIQKMGREIIR